MVRLFIFLVFVLLLSFTHSTPSASHDRYLRAERLGVTFISSIDIPHSSARYARALELGAGWNRWPLYWERVESRPGRFDWSRYDDLLEADQAQGLRNNVILLGIPAVYREGESINGLDAPVFTDGTDILGASKTINAQNPWARFVYEAVQRYKPGGVLGADGGVRVWEIWNEPDFEMFWSGGVAAYARLLQVAYLAAHRADPEAVVMFGGLLYGSERNWLAQVLDLYADDPTVSAQHNWYMDAVAVHNYGDAWRSGWLTLYVRQTLAAYQLERPIWLNETGVSVWDDYPGPTWTQGEPQLRRARATSEQQAAFLIQSSAYAWAEGAQAVFFHQLYDDCGDQPPGTDFPPNDGELCALGAACFGDAFGIYRNAESSVCYSQHPQPESPRPVAEAYVLLAEVFGSQPFSRRGVVEDARTDGVITITFSRPETDERVVVIWNTEQTPLTFNLPAQGGSALVYRMGAEQPQNMLPQDNVYALELPAAAMPRQRFLSERLPVDIGGAPLILVEPLDEERAAALEYLTFESTSAPAASTAAPDAGLLSPAQIAELTAASPTGVAFVSFNNARLRSAPDVESSRVVGSIPYNSSASVIGRSADNGWLFIEYSGQRAWVAAFLGQVYGDLTSVRVMQGRSAVEPAPEATEAPSG